MKFSKQRHRASLALLCGSILSIVAGSTDAAFVIFPIETSGTGLGSVNTILTVQDTPTESGCVGRGAGVDILGPSACLGANTGGDEGTGTSQTQTRSLAELGLTSADNLRAVLNANQTSGGPIQLDSLVLGIYSDTGTLLFTSSIFVPILFPFTFEGTGNAGFVFRLDPADTLAAQPFFANPTNRVGLSASLSRTTSGAETFFIADAGGIAPPAIDLAVTKIDSADPAVVGSQLTYTVTVRNNGPNTATNVVVTDTLPASVNVVSITPSQGTCTRNGAVITCAVGTVGIGQSATIQIVVIATATGSISNSVSATATQADTVPANNTATQTTLIVGATPQTVPTLSNLALGILGVAMLAMAALSRRRREVRPYRRG